MVLNDPSVWGYLFLSSLAAVLVLWVMFGSDEPDEDDPPTYI